MGNCPGAGANGTSKDGKYWYLFKYKPSFTKKDGTVVNPDGPPELTGKDLVESGITQDVDPNTGSPIVNLQFTGHGSKEFKAITQAEYNRGRVNAGGANQLNPTGPNAQSIINQYAGHNAIVLDGQLQSTPYIDYTDASLSPGIVGNAIITEPSAKAAGQTAFVLQSGSLPYSFKQLASTKVSATLGKSSLHQAILAAIVGLLIVAIFLLVLYRFLGLVAVFGLAIYALLYYAAILLFDVTLTLPGFAGLILTIGVAADANVVVFERIKEEVRAGRSVRAAISAGYGKGFHTIIDANVVTMITALVIFLVAVADVKGFALMLLIGTVISLLTAVVATRAMLGLLSGFKWFDSPRFMGAQGQQTAKWLQIDFMGKRKLWFAISGAIIIAGLISLGAQGLNLGIDFKGGTQQTFKTHKPYSQGQVQAFMAQQGQPDAVVQGQGQKSANGDFTNWQVRTKTLDRAEQLKLNQALHSDLGAHGGEVKSVSGTFGHQIAMDAIYAIVVSLLLITIYIALRFDLKFAIPVIIAMLHDIAITIGVYSLVGKEVTVDTVAAVLTVLGYSIYDTIIIFDRIRENMPADAPLAVRDDRQRLVVGDDQALAGHDVHHAAADHLPPDLRRHDAQGLRLRAHRRRHLGCLLLDLHRGAAAHDVEGARAGVRAPEASRRAGGRGAGRRDAGAPQAVAAEGRPGTRPRHGRAGGVGGGSRRRADAEPARRGDSPEPATASARREKRSAAAAFEAAWPRAVAATCSSTRSRSFSPSCRAACGAAASDSRTAPSACCAASPTSSTS